MTEPQSEVTRRDAVRLRVLGATDLSHAGAPVSAVLTQPKRLGLLAYLALARPGSFQRRDHLLGHFWPSSSPDRARANLRQAVRFLRKALGAEIVVGRGDGELAIGDGVLTCDALDFRQAVDRGDPEAALEHYSGELLTGLFVSGAPEFERWLSAERRELREAARDAAAALTESAEAGDRIQDAIEWARRAMELDPLDEVSARRLILLLDRVGRRAEALNAYTELRARLAAELELSPAPETEAIIAGLRQEGAPGASGIEVRTAVQLDPLRVVVLPYRNQTGTAEHDVVGTMAADWIAQGLAHNPELSVVPPVVSRAAETGAEPPGPGHDEPLTSLAVAMGAGTMITGAVEAAGSDLVFRTTVFDAVRRRLLPAPEAVASPRSEPLRSLAELSDAVAGCLAPLLSTKSVHAQRAERPPTFQAYRAYLGGLDLFIDGDWAGALAEFRQAWEEEAGYALPRVVSAIALWNLGRLPEAMEVASHAKAVRDSLGPFERGTLDMVLGWLHGDWRTAYGGARRQADLAPGSLASCQVAEEARRLNRPREALDILTSLDPSEGELRGWAFYWVELCTAHHLLGDHRVELDAARRAVSLHPGSPLAISLEVRALAASGDLDALLDWGYRILATPSGGSPSPGALLRRIALELAAHEHPDESRYLEMSEEWWSEQTQPSNPVDRRERGLTLYHMGRLEEAREIFRGLVATGDEALPSLDEHHGHLRGHLDQGYLALIADRLGDSEEAERWRHYLQDLDEPFLYGAKWLWLAALSARTGDLDRGVSYLRRAFIDGLPFSVSLHTTPDLEPLRDHPGFKGVMAAKG